MKAQKKGNLWEIIYRIPGYRKLFTERFESKEEANVRIAEIEFLRSKGNLKPPSTVTKNKYITVGEFLDEYVDQYGALHWGDSYYSCAVHRINDYIKPFIGELLLRDLTTRDLDEFYSRLLETPAVTRSGHRKTSTVSYDVIERISCIMRSSLVQAQRWQYITFNPAEAARVPKRATVRRKVWTPEQAKRAIELCQNTNLKVCMLLAIACSLRIGEILGLQWDGVHVSQESIEGITSFLEINQELKRCDKTTLAVLESKKRTNVFFTFPETKNDCKTVLVLKTPKTESSIRTVYIPKTVAQALITLRQEQNDLKKELEGYYQDFNMVIAQNDGRPTEERLIAKELKSLIKENDLPEVVFHSLRHLSTSMKLQVSGGDIKAVQGDTGHSQANMVTDVYAHTFDDNRKRIAERMEASFFEPELPEREKANPDQARILEILASNPQLGALILAMANKPTQP